MMRNMRSGVPRLFKDGSKQFSGVDETALKNIEACRDLATITRTSMGPNGMNKMVINYLEKLFVTSDAATIIKEMEVIHPAAKMVVMAASMQEREIGDGSNSVVIFAGELCQMAEGLIHEGLHTKDIVKGYGIAVKKALQILDELVVYTATNLKDKTSLVRGIKAAVSAKQFGYADFLAPLIADACLVAMPADPLSFVVDNVRVCKVPGGTVRDAEVVRGMVSDRMVEGNVHSVENAKIALFSCSIDASGTETKGTVLIHDAKELMSYNVGEEKHIEKNIQCLVDAGVKVVICGSNISEMAQHFLEKFGIMALKISSKFELRRLAKTTGCRALVKMGPVSQEQLGFCSKVFVREVGGRNVTVFEQAGEDSPVATILVRGSTQNVMSDIERAIDDGVNTVRAMTRDGRFVAGAGACEIELAKQLADFGAGESSVAQYSIKKFAEALEVFPRILAANAGMPHSKVVTDLYVAHSQKDGATVGVDIEGAGVADMTQKDILDLLISKRSILKLSTDAVMTILRVDQLIMAKPAGGPKMGQKQGHWDDN